MHRQPYCKPVDTGKPIMTYVFFQSTISRATKLICFNLLRLNDAATADEVWLVNYGLTKRTRGQQPTGWYPKFIY